MRKFTLSMLVLLVSVFFMNQSSFGQAMHSKSLNVGESGIAVVHTPRTNDSFDMADMYSIDFEDEVEWTFDFMPWIAVDEDLLPTYGMTGVTWPGSGDPQAFIVFNPATTDPPLTDDDEIQPHSGDQFGACLAAVPDGSNGNDDWFISDMVMIGDGASFTFWAKSYTDQYGLERFNVAVSTTTPDPAEFTVISGASYIEAPMAWTEYTYDLSMYAGMDVYVAIQCVTFDAFVFMIDDLVIDPGAEPSACDNFDELTVGGYVADQLGGLWTTWSGAPGTAEDALVSDLYSVSPANSILVEGTTDLVRMFGDENFTSGTYIFTNDIYIPTGTTGYWNLQKDVIIGTEWGFQIMYEDDMTMVIDAGAAAAAVIPYAYDTWYHNEIIVDLDNDWCDFYIDGVLIIGYQWTLGTFGTAGANTLGSCNFYANPGAGGTPPGAHFDDICFEEVVVEPCENFDALTAGLGVAEQLGGYWTTWSGGATDDAMVSDAQANSDPNSFVVDAAATDLIFQFGDDPIAEGQWLYSNYIYVPTGFSGYFNVQSEPTPGVDWNIELYFDDGGTGSFAGQSTETFTYDQDMWFLVEINYDLDAGLAEVLFDGVLITTFENAMTIGSIDYYGSDSGGDPGAYYDDVCFGEGWEISDAVCENFDALTPGLGVADQLGGYWTTWSGGATDDAMVSDAQANSDPNSFVVDAAATDLIFQFGDDPIAEGQWLYSNYIYVPTGFSGYFNVQSEPTPGVDWNIELYFDDGGTGSFAGQSTETFTYDQDMWFLVEINYDLDAGLAEVLFDGVLITTFENAMTIGSIDYYGSDSGGDPGAYYDDVCFGTGWVMTGIEEPTANSNSAVVYPNPATDKITIESKNIIDEVRIYNNMGKLVYSGEFNNDQIMVNTSTYITGMYIVQVRSGETVEVRKLIIE